ncbi:uncharacterized protein LOC117299243 [Asterias rubens]|uniref:uncharacterized protein LOC117299243 n=1 Tax=Asterias rubens TaxID=7604 RepID=UPI001454E4B2|nr:uncharacterized protein LOC117299243 [Asterias rubens]
MADSIVPDLHCDEVLLPDDELRLDETFLGEAGPGVFYKQTTLPRSTVVFPADEPQYCHAVLPAPRGNIEVGETSSRVDPDCEEHLLFEDAQYVPSMSHEDMTLIQQSSAAPHTTEVNEFHLPTGTVHAACLTPCHPQTPTEAFTQREPDSTLLTLLLKHQRSYLQMKESVGSNKSCNELESSSHWHSDLLFDDVCDCDAHLVPITRWDVEE